MKDGFSANVPSGITLTNNLLAGTALLTFQPNMSLFSSANAVAVSITINITDYLGELLDQVVYNTTFARK